MAINQIAPAAKSVFGATLVQTTAGRLPLDVVMLAIAGSETGGTWDPAARGDQGLDPQYGTCQGFSSWGAWQIHNVHRAYLIAQTGSQAPCAWYAWLSNPTNCAKAALAVYQGQGLAAWTTYNDGSWRAHLAAAQTAIAALASGSGTGGSKTAIVAPPTPLPPAWMLVVGVGGVTAGAGIVALALRPDWARAAREALVGPL